MKKSSLSNIISFISGPIISAAIGLLIIPITTNLLSVEDFGKLNLFLISQTFIFMFIYLAMDHSFIRFYNIANKQSLLANILVLPIIVTVILYIIALFQLKNISLFLFDTKESYLVILLLLAIPFGILERFSQLIIRLEDKGSLYAFLIIFSKLIVLILIVVTSVIMNLNYSIVGTIYFISQALSACLSLFFTRKHWKDISFNNINKKEIIKYARYALPMYPSTLMVWGLNSITIVLLRIFSSYSDMGIYSAATRVTNIINVLQSAVMSFWQPMVYRWDSQNKPLKLYKLAAKLIIISISLCFIFILIFKDYFILLLSNSFIESIALLPILLFVPFMSLNSEIVGIGINIAKKTYLNTIFSFITLCILILLGIISISSYGALGAALVNGTAYIVFYLMKLFASSKVWKDLDSIFYVVNLISLVVLSLSAYYLDNYISVILMCITMVVYVVMLYITYLKLNKLIKGRN
ncbi:lipopolysaccharide biosynthesis protein [Terribacillus sp. 179-K 1B1 HS]|uniref:lipopolysaccharide biosynthesis protein n=1 Tax=Terribacillus sp. 179-K 1B1 HS TaxID=3142388 RepID=UPI00399EF3C2